MKAWIINYAVNMVFYYAVVSWGLARFLTGFKSVGVFGAYMPDPETVRLLAVIMMFITTLWFLVGFVYAPIRTMTSQGMSPFVLKPVGHSQHSRRHHPVSPSP